MALATISALLSAGSAIGGLISNIVQTKKKERQMRADQREMESMLEAQANQNGLNTKTAQAALTRMDRDADETMEQVRASNAIMGGTPEVELAAMEKLSQAKADTVSNLASAYETNVAQPMQQKLIESKQSFNQANQEMADQKIASTQAAIQAGASALGNITSAVDSPARKSASAPSSTNGDATAHSVSVKKNATGQAVRSTGKFERVDESELYPVNPSAEDGQYGEKARKLTKPTTNLPITVEQKVAQQKMLNDVTKLRFNRRNL